MKRKSKKFHLGDILSITTGVLVSPRLVEGIYDILNYMTGDDLYTHQLPRAAGECEPYLLMEMPWLKDISGEGIGRDNWRPWLAGLVEKFGEYHDVYPIHPEDHEQIDPIEELLEQGVDESKIFTVEVPEDVPPNPWINEN